MPSYRILCLENPLLDIQASCDEALLQKYSLKPNDAILAEEKHLSIYDDLQARDAKLIAGGAAQNTARGAQYLLPADSVLYIGAVGTDTYAEKLDEACQKAGLATEYLRLKEYPTGRCGVVITGSDRSLVTDLAAANHYTLEHLKSPNIWAYAEKAELMYVGGYHLTVCPEAAIALGEEAARRNVPFAFGMGAPFIPAFFKEPLAKVLPYVDYLFGNETEAATWAENNGLEKGLSIPEIAKAMAASAKQNSQRKRTVIITQGLDPTIVASGDGQVKELPVHPIPNEQICDTNGAGDAFAGGFLAGLVEGKDLETCVDMAMWLAAQSLRELGPSYVPASLSFPLESPPQLYISLGALKRRDCPVSIIEARKINLKVTSLIALKLNEVKQLYNKAHAWSNKGMGGRNSNRDESKKLCVTLLHTFSRSHLSRNVPPR